MRKKLVVLVALTIAMAALITTPGDAATPAPIPVTGCGAIVPANTTGVVQNDFTCTANPSVDKHFGIVLKRNAVLDLNGHTITLVQDDQTIGPVLCEGNCTVKNGTLTNTAEGGGVAVQSFKRGRITAADLTISRMTVGIETTGQVIATRVSIQTRHAGIWLAKKVVVNDVDVTLPGGDQQAECVGASQSGGSVDGNDLTVTGCRHGVYGTVRVDVTGLTVTDSGIGVFSGGKLALTDSGVTGSSQYDLYSKKRPVLVNTTCGTSGRVWNKPGIPTWGVCAND